MTQRKPLMELTAGIGVTPNLKRLIFTAPFNPFVHRWTALIEALNDEQDEVTKTHLQLLYNILDGELRDVIDAKQDFIKNKVITYEHLWTIYEPGATIYTREWGRDCGSKLSQGKYIEHPKYGPCYQLTSQIVEWDGDKFGYTTKNSLIVAYGGTLPITSLGGFPLQFHPKRARIEAVLLERGRLFELYHGYHYRAYKAFAIGKDRCGKLYHC